MPAHWSEDPAGTVVHRSFLIASETGDRARPIHLLAALSEVDGRVGDVVRAGHGPVVRRMAEPPPVNGGGSGYLLSQTVQAARQLAEDRREAMGPEHLLLAVVDQGEQEALDGLAGAGLVAATVRRVALDILGAPPDLPSLVMPPLTPAGTHDRPPLTIDQLDPQAWHVLTWRQQHLPLYRIRSVGDWYALSALERRAAWRLANRLDVDDDQRYSLSSRHHDRVEELAHAAHPTTVETREQLRRSQPFGGRPIRYRHRSLWRRLAPGWMVGWPTWFSNRRVGLRDRRFRLVTWPIYRGTPVAE